ncbi:hypothetical protein ACXO70_07355, partial [Lactobacillus delbrueckii subsp. bulgaricus]
SLIEYLLAKLLSFQGFIVLFWCGKFKLYRFLSGRNANLGEFRHVFDIITDSIWNNFTWVRFANGDGHHWNVLF